MIDHPKATICGFDVATAGREAIVAAIVAATTRGHGAWLVTLNLEMLARVRRDATYRDLLHRADAFVADGMPIVWASRWKRTVPPIAARCAGVDLVSDLLRHPTRPPTAVIGGDRPSIALARLGRTVEHLDDGRIELTPAWIDGTAAALRAKSVRLVFVALGVPKADLVAQALRARVPGAIFIGVGGSFEMLGGLKPRAPVWLQEAGLEWLFRLAVEPRRLWRRYLLVYPVGAAWLLRDVLTGRGLRGP